MKRILLLTALLFSLSIHTALASNWVWIFSTNTTNYYIDLANIQDFYENGERKIIVWEKHTYNDAGIQNVIAGRETNDLDITRFENLDNEISRCMYIYKNNGDKHLKILYTSYYDTSGHILENTDYVITAKTLGKSINVLLLPPDTAGENMANCALEIANIYKDLNAYKRSQSN